MEMSKEQNISTKSIANNTPAGDFTNSNVQLRFYPTLENLHKNLVSLQEMLMEANKHCIPSIIISTNSSLILLLVPLIVPIKEKLLIEFCFDSQSSRDLYSENYEQCRHFKEILESSQILKSMGFDVAFSKTFNALPSM